MKIKITTDFKFKSLTSSNAQEREKNVNKIVENTLMKGKNKQTKNKTNLCGKRESDKHYRNVLRNL